jgi:AmmeMemoRadiSam system protein A
MLFLSEDDRAKLLQLAHRAIVETVTRRELPGNIPHHGILGQPHGVFVTLHKRGELRGCIGTTETTEALADAVVRCAASAALHDPRFPPVTTEETHELEIEISVLSPLQQIQPEAIEIGKHGLVISDVNHRGLLLPQVAVEHRLTREQFLAETCRKAGLPRDAWQSPATHIQAFTCEIFADHDHRGLAAAEG